MMSYTPEKRTTVRPWTLPTTRQKQKVHTPKIDTYFKQINDCKKQYSKLRLTPEVPKTSSMSPLPYIFPRSLTYSGIELSTKYTKSSPTGGEPSPKFSKYSPTGVEPAPKYSRCSPKITPRSQVKVAWHNKDKCLEDKRNNSFDSEKLSVSDENSLHEEQSRQTYMNPIQLSQHLRDSGFGSPVMFTSSAHQKLSKFNLPPGVRSRRLPKNPSKREKIKGRARLDYEMANMRAMAFCEQQAPKAFRTASAHMRNRDVQFVEDEMKEHMQRVVDNDNIEIDDNASIVMAIDRDELFERIEIWIEDVNNSLDKIT